MAFDAVNAALILSKGVGIPPNDMQSFNAQSQEDGIKITFTGPKNSYVYGAENSDTLVCTPAGVMVRYSDTDYPKTIKEGTLAIDFNYNDNDVDPTSPTEQTHKQVGLTMNTTYYFTAFPYSIQGVYNLSQNTKNKATVQWVGNKGTISVNVQTPQGYTGSLGEYAITLVDQATESPQNIEKTANGPGVTQFGNLVAGKSYKVRLGTPEAEDLIAPADSEAITIVAGTNHSVTMTYGYKYGIVQVNVASVPAGMRSLGSYTVTLTPQSGGQAISQKGSGAQTLTFNNLIGGETYTVGLTTCNHYTANPNGSVTVVAQQTTQHNANYTFSASFSEATWQEISDVIQCADTFLTYFSYGDSRTINVKKYTGSIAKDGSFDGSSTSENVEFVICARNGASLSQKAPGSLKRNNNTMILWPKETLLNLRVSTTILGESVGFSDTGINKFLYDHRSEMIPSDVLQYVPIGGGNSPQYCSVGLNNDGNGYWEFADTYYNQEPIYCGLFIPTARQIGASKSLIPRGTSSKAFTDYLYSSTRRKLDAAYGTKDVVNADYQSTDKRAFEADPRWVKVDANGNISTNESDHIKISGSPTIRYPVVIAIN